MICSGVLLVQHPVDQLRVRVLGCRVPFTHVTTLNHCYFEGTALSGTGLHSHQGWHSRGTEASASTAAHSGLHAQADTRSARGPRDSNHLSTETASGSSAWRTHMGGWSDTLVVLLLCVTGGTRARVWSSIDDRSPVSCSVVQASLERLQMDYVDLLYCHRPDPNTPMIETVRAWGPFCRRIPVWHAVATWCVYPHKRQAIIKPVHTSSTRLASVLTLVDAYSRR